MTVVSQESPRISDPGEEPSWRRLLTSTWTARALFYLSMLTLWIVMSAAMERFPSPPATVRALIFEFNSGEVLTNFAITMSRFLVALALSIVLGVAIGLLIGLSRWAYAIFDDIVMVGLTLPAILWAFLTIVWYGFDSRAQILAAVLTTVPFVIINVSKGVGGISRELRDMAQTYRVPRVRRLRQLIIPAVYGYVIVGTRIGAVLAWNVVLLSEWFGSNSGIGFRSRYWYDANDYSGFLGWAILFVVVLLMMDLGILAPLERRAFRWRDGDKSSSHTSPVEIDARKAAL